MQSRTTPASAGSPAASTDLPSERSPVDARLPAVRRGSQSPRDERPNSVRSQGPQSYRRYSYVLVDVFTGRRFSGSPLAVFTDARGLTQEQMQRIANELNHSETTFVFPPLSAGNDYSVRIFSPRTELPAVTHTTIGTAYALAQKEAALRGAERSEVPVGADVGLERERYVFDEQQGPVSVHMVSPVSMMRQPLPRFGARYAEPSTAAAILSLSASDLAAGLPLQAVASSVSYLLVPVAKPEALARIRLRLDIWERTLKHFEAPQVCAFCVTPAGSTTVRTRTFAPALGVLEAAAAETVCGPLTAYLVRHRLVPEAAESFLVFEQGMDIGRPSYVHVTACQEQGELTEIRVGGECIVVGEGTLFV